MKHIAQTDKINFIAALLLSVTVGGPVLGAAESDSVRGPAITTPQTLALDDAIQWTLQNNPDLRAASERVEAAGGRAIQAGVWQNPGLELTAEEWPVNRGRGFSDAKQTLGVAQTLPFPGKKALDRQIGQSGVKLSEAHWRLRKTELIRDVKAAFYRVLAAEQLVSIAGELVQVAESSAGAARKRADAGATPYQEQLRAEIQLEEARGDLNGAQREVEMARQGLAGLLGRPDLKHAALEGTLVETPESRLMATGAEARLDEHPSLSTAQAQANQARLELRRARLEPYPDVTVGLAGGRLGDADQSIVELRFSLPLPIIDRSKGRQQEARANLAAAQAELTATRQQLEREWVNALQRYRAAAERVAIYRDRILPKASEALRLVQVGFDEGKFSFIDLLDTQRTSAEARLAYQNRLLEMHIAQAELEALLQPSADMFLNSR